MKKFIFSIVMIALLLPVHNTFAYSGGLLNGKPLNFGSDQNSITSVNSQVTDNIDVTAGSIIGPNASSTDTMWYQFSREVNISEVQIKAGLSASAFKISFYNGSTLISSVTPNNITGVKYNFTANNVTKVAVSNLAKEYIGMYEFDVFESTPPIVKDPVTNLSETHNFKSVDLSWNNPTNIGLSNIVIKQNGTQIVELPATTTTYSITNLLADTNYNFDVYAKYSDGGLSAVSSINVKTDVLLPPNPITNLNTNPSYDKVNLSWTLPTMDNFKQVNIYRDGVRIASSTASTYTDKGLEEDTTYEYVVKVESTENIESTGMTKVVKTTIKPVSPPPTLSGVEYIKSENGDYTYSWTQPTEGTVKIIVGGAEYRIVDAATRSIVIPATDMKYTALKDPDISLIPVSVDGVVGEATKPSDSISTSKMPFGASDVLGSGFNLLFLVGPFVLLALAFLVVPSLRKLITDAFNGRDNSDLKGRRTEEVSSQREPIEKEERMKFERNGRERTARERSIGRRVR